MNNFDIYNPTHIAFGKEQIERLPQLLNKFSAKKILLAYGGGSIKTNGIYDRVVKALEGFEVVEFSGIEPNPQYSTLMKAVESVKTNGIDFILAVGGGSVIDGIKFVSGAAKYDGEPWDVLQKKEGCVFNAAVPFGAVLTLPATGSEANSGGVISRAETKEKLAMGGPLFFPKFSVCEPGVVASLPKRQIANGIADAYMHTLEQYLTMPMGNRLQERHAEGILLTLREIAHDLLANPADYDLAANFMYAATHALNGNLRAGVAYDWCTHMIGHELTALYGIDHARTLAIIAPRLFDNQYENKKEMLAQYGARVLGIEGPQEFTAKTAIVETEIFFQSLGIDTKLSQYTDDTSEAATIIKNRFIERGWTKMGERGAITPDDVEQIVLKSI